RPTPSKKMGMLPADEKSSAQAGSQRGDPSLLRKRPNGSAGLSFHATVAYQAAAPTDATPWALAWPYAVPLRVLNSSIVVAPANWNATYFTRCTSAEPPDLTMRIWNWAAGLGPVKKSATRSTASPDTTLLVPVIWHVFPLATPGGHSGTRMPLSS